MKMKMTYYPDITQKQDPEDVHNAIVKFGELLSALLTEQLGSEVKVEVPPVMSVPDQYTDILSGNSQIALMKPVAYVFAHGEDSDVVPACVAHRPIDDKVGTFYFAQIYARAELGIRSLEDLANFAPGKLRIAYGDRFSTSNFLIPASMLKKTGTHPFLHFKETVFAGGHDGAAEAVYHNKADIGAGHDGVIKILSDDEPDAADKLIQIGRENIHSDPVVVNLKALPEGVTLEHIQKACTTAAKTDEWKAALDLFWGWVKDLSPTGHENYASIETALKNLNLEVSDMI